MLRMEDRVPAVGDFSVVDGEGDRDDQLNDGDALCIDLESFLGILDEEPGSTQCSQEDTACKNLSLRGDTDLDAGSLQESIFQTGSQVIDGALLETDPQSNNSEASDSRTGGSSGSFDYHGNLESSMQNHSPAYTDSASFKDWHALGQDVDCTEKAGVSKFEMPSCSRASSFVDGDRTHISDHRDSLVHNFMESEAVIGSRHSRGACDYVSSRPVMENLDVKSGYYGHFSENRMQTLPAPDNVFPTSMGLSFMDADMSIHNVTSTESTIYRYSDAISDFSDRYSSMSYGLNPDGMLLNNFNIQVFLNNEDRMSNKKDEIVEFPTESACSSTRVILNAHREDNGGSISRIEPSDERLNFKFEGGNHASTLCDTNDGHIEDKALSQMFSHNHLSLFGEKHVVCVKDSISRKSYYDTDEIFFAEDSEHSFLHMSPYLSSQMPVVCTKDEKGDMISRFERASYFQDIIDGSASRSFIASELLNINASQQILPDVELITLSKRQLGCVTDKTDGKLILSKGMDSQLLKVSPESTQSNSFDCRSHIDDDPDVCIIESQPACQTQSLVLRKPSVPLQQLASNDCLHYSGAAGMRIKPNDERLIFRAALQDLSQPKSEASPPDGVLAVPLLRHQRIALSWMIQKETTSLYCSGGILADDQGLGKTVSTIALILKERPPSFRSCLEEARKCELETLNVDDDEDDDVAPQLNGVKQESQVMSNGSSMRTITLGQAKGRPAAGTLIVCPTSVLRQWAEELQNKVTSKANLSVLVYHGTNRTRDPCELAKYDVVLTTYSIVSMEVPKQPLVDADDEEKGKLEGDSVSPMGFSSNKKRKYALGSDKKGSKRKKGEDSAVFESIARPLAKVGWFRVVLDEAQSIKNHRTQVARACWGLRAKRRWCLSGTPIQNAIDDLYSYFRFLRYDPYAGYKSFCSTIKVPITRNPAKGYRKLQAVLKTIMLRRTKGTLLDGEPIITLPPKVVELKKVDFTKEERDFYSRLEKDSRDQFKEYAEAGTVKQNYVNILLMLLRLRQACDHPLLVKGFDSNSEWRSSVEMAKKLPREKQIYLLNCLEASLAICRICNDPPEDAVVSVCSHVFCKQCICERLSGDDNQCPVTNCKFRLNVSSVFTKATLSSSLSEIPGHDSTVDCSGSELFEVVGPNLHRCSYDSSKIKAALEVLQSLARPGNHTSTDSSLQNPLSRNDGSPENSFDCDERDALEDNMNEDNKMCDAVKLLGEKAIVFSQWTRMLDLLEACLKNSNIQYRRLDGTMSVVARDKAVKDFNTLPEVSVMIMSLKAASLGLNMVAACHVLLLDLWWNPTTEDQAIDRAHRIGQTRPVTVLRLTVKDTVEDRILALQQKKREMVASAFGEDETGGRQARLTVEDLKYLFMV